MNAPTKQPTTERPRPAPIAVFLMVAGSSFLFCSKGVVAKMAYAHGVDALTVLALRMGFALPFFLFMAVAASRGMAPLGPQRWAKLLGLGFLGYYLSSLVNFTGLQYVSIGLERMILYTYPTLVLAFSALCFRKKVRFSVWAASAVTWTGIVCAFLGELHNPHPSGKAIWGGALIFLSALTYAWFLLLGGHTVLEVGPMRFTGVVVGFSAILVLGHFFLARPAATLVQLPAAVYLEGAFLGLCGTVAPAVLLSYGMKFAGAQKLAIISTIGPMATLFLAWAILGERPNASQLCGFLLTLSGGLAVGLLKENQ